MFVWVCAGVELLSTGTGIGRITQRVAVQPVRCTLYQALHYFVDYKTHLYIYTLLFGLSVAQRCELDLLRKGINNHHVVFAVHKSPPDNQD
jgi:hypothetical protein